MKKALPFIIGAVLIIIVIIVLTRRKAKADLETMDVLPGTSFDYPEFPTENQNPDTATVIAPENTATTPPVVVGNPPAGPGCINNTIVVKLIKAWKSSGLIKRIAYKNELRQICPAALIYLVR